MGPHFKILKCYTSYASSFLKEEAMTSRRPAVRNGGNELCTEEGMDSYMAVSHARMSKSGKCASKT